MADERRSGQNMWDGTLSGEDFQFAAKEFLKLWNNHQSNTCQWRWQECSHSSAQGYLILEDVILATINDDDDNKEDEIEEEENIPDSATLGMTAFTRQPARCAYHVIYNESYRVPTIFFRGHHSDGRPLNWFDVQKSLSSELAPEVEENKWTFLTQEEHPYLHRPWFMLHPCGTSSIMALIFSERTKNIRGDKLEGERNVSMNFRPYDGDLDHKRAVTSGQQSADSRNQYLLAWLSFVGPVVGVTIPLDLFKSFE